MPTDLFLCGHWDGVNVWLQWIATPEEIATGFELDLSYAPNTENAPWTDWRRIGGTDPIHRYWMSVPTWREGQKCRARLRAAGANDDAWITAHEVRFLQSTCLFEISTQNKAVSFPKDHIFARIVDGASCAYVLGDPVELQPGETVSVTMTAHAPSGFMQLDYQNHFDLSPSLGVRIRNLEPSQADVQATGFDFTLLDRIPPGKTPLVAAFGDRNF